MGRRVETTLLIGAVALYVAFVARSAFRIDGELYFTLLDDGMISMRYARNLATGHGLVWNHAGVPVEGYSNFLWTLWMAALHLLPLPLSKMSLAVMTSGVVILVANLVVVRGVLSEWLGARRTFPVLAGTAAVAFCYPLMYWTLKGMEVGLSVLLLNVCCLFAFRCTQQTTSWRPGWPLFAALGALPLVRDDMLLSAGIVAVFVAVIAYRRGAWMIAAAAIAAVIVPKALHLVFRLTYYGHMVPNTYYLKMTGASLFERLPAGARVATEIALRSLVLPIAVVAVAAIVKRVSAKRQQLDSRLVLLAALAAANVAYSVYVGGDVWDWMKYANRFATVGLPALLMLMAAGLDALWMAEDEAFGPRAVTLLSGFAFCVEGAVDLLGKGSLAGMKGAALGSAASLAQVCCGTALLGMGAAMASRGRLLALLVRHTIWPGVVLIVLALSAHDLGQWALRNAQSMYEDQQMVRLGTFLHRATSADATIAATWAGAIPYFADRPAIDITGKNDAVVARGPARAPFNPGLNKWDLEHSILDLAPDVVADASQAVPDLAGQLRVWGYLEEPNGLFVRQSSTRVDRSCIGRGRWGAWGSC